MAEVVAYIFLVCAVVSLLLALVSLITPRTAFFLRKRTRLRAMLGWFGISCVCFIIMAAFAPKNQHTTAENQQKNSVTSEKSPSTAEHQPKVEKLQLVSYRQAEIEDTSIANRKRGQVRIVLADPASAFTAEQLTATCMAAAKFYAREYGFRALSVFFSDIPGDKPWEGTRLAQCSYSPDKGGWSGSQGWTWEQVMAAPRGLTAQEREMKKLWGQLRSKFQKDGATDETALKSAIAKKMNIKPDQVTLLWFMLDKTSTGPFEGVAPQGPVGPKAAATPTVLTADEVRAQVRELLAELDGFKDSGEFRQCVYGCGKRSPGNAWNAKRKALQDKMTPQLDVPLLLKAAPGELWSLGMAYAKGKNEEAREIRADIEKALAQ